MLRSPAFFLLLATIFWSFSFAWTKDAVTLLNRACNLDAASHFGTFAVLGARFLTAAVLWFTLFPKALPLRVSSDGWFRLTVTSTLFTLGLVFQTLCLAQTSDAISAFLTSLVVLFVPMIMAFLPGAMRFIRCHIDHTAIPNAVWLAVAIALPGIVLMSWQPTPTPATTTAPAVLSAAANSAATAQHLWGIIFGVLCAVVFSFHLFSVNEVVRQQGSFRVTGTQFLITSLLTLPIALLFFGVPPHTFLAALLTPDIAWRIAMLVLLPGVVAFGLATHFQPKVEPYRAALIYLLEPVLASAFAFVSAGRGLSALQLLGAAIILLANALCEYAESKHRKKHPIPQPAS
jgi:drug/metabolite transporter (DMT)-like permease